MNQIDLIQAEQVMPANPPAQAPVQIAPVQGKTRSYRGCQVPATYIDTYGMRTFRQPVLFWVLDLILDALELDSMHWYDLPMAVGVPVSTSTLSRHLLLLESAGLISAEPVYFGSSSPRLGNYRGYQKRYHLAESEAA